MLVIGLASALASCTTDSATIERSSSTVETTEPEARADLGAGAGESEPEEIPGPVEPTAEQLAQLAALPGRLAVEQQRRLVVVDPDGANLQALDGSESVIAIQPVWSANGDRLAWSRTTLDTHELVVVDMESGEEALSDTPGPPAFYLQWSADGEALAYLRNDPGGRGVELGFARPGSAATPLLASAPLYLSWAPQGSSVAAHVGDSQVIIVPDLLIGPAADVDDPIVIVNPSGEFTTPVWLDESTLLVNSPGGLALVDVNTERSAVIVDSASPVRFVVSPDRSKVAYLVPGLDSGVSRVSLAQADPVGGLVVFDLVTGESTAVTGESPIAWEWSPDSRQLAWLESGLSALRPQSRWHFWDGENTSSADPFRISRRELQSVLPFFEQYAQSHRHWSPDSTAFVFTGQSEDAETGAAGSVWVHLVGAGGPSIMVADGDLAIWSN